MPAPKDPEANALWHKRLSEAKLKSWEDPDYREARSKERKAKPKSPSHRAAIAAAHIGIGHTPATRALLSEINTGKTLSEDTRKKIGDAHRGRTRTPEHNDLMKKLIQANWDSLSLEERQARNSHSSETAKKTWEEFWLPEYENKSDIWDARVHATMLGNQIKPNKAEVRLQEILDTACPDCYKFVGDGSTIIGGKNPDFIYGNRIIEFFGDYWHAGEDPSVKISHFAQYGFKTLVIWEHELKDSDLMDRVIAFTGVILQT